MLLRSSMRTDELDFHLPPELIAQSPTSDRAASRLLNYSRVDRSVAHRQFSDLPRLLRRGDLLVFNDTRVLPARFMLRKLDTGGFVEGLFIRQTAANRWRVLLKNLSRYRGVLQFGNALINATVVASHGDGEHDIELDRPVTASEVLRHVGRMPLPPYIKRDKWIDIRDRSDQERYQTVYANEPGAVAAPTAGLHFTRQLFAALNDAGVEQTFVTLHVGLGTFKPVTADTLEAHQMHAEEYSISAGAAAALNRAKADRRRIIAVGTTSARVLESQTADEPFAAKNDQTSIFIYPPYTWRHVDALITNFHLPRSTLIAMIAALVGLDEQRRLYQLAIEESYRFFSYGDAMLIE